MSGKKKLSVALLAVPETTASTIYGMYDLFSSAGRDWGLIETGSPGVSKAAPFVVTTDSAAFRGANGVWIRPDSTFDECPVPDLVCVTDLLVPPGVSIAGQYPEAVEWLARCYDAGATISSACSGAILLAEAGLLNGYEATTHWGYCDSLRKFYPEVEIHESRALVASGDGQRLITAGGGASWYDLALFLIARFLGEEEAMRLARVYLLDWQRVGQLPYASLLRNRQVDDKTIGACQEWIADNYTEPSPVAGMLGKSGLTERTFKRRFTRATGLAPMDYVHTLRLEEAKQILETTSLPIEEIARDVGYEDGSFFRRLFRRKVGITPQDYRKRFGSIRQALRTAELTTRV